jgi:hypothetical protein
MLWDLGSGKRLKTMTGHTDFVYSLDFSSDGNVLVSGSADCTVRVWDVKRDTPYALSVKDMDGVDRGSGSSDSLAKRMKLDKDAKLNGKDKPVKKDDKSKDGDDSKKSVTERYDLHSIFLLLRLYFISLISTFFFNVSQQRPPSFIRNEADSDLHSPIHRTQFVPGCWSFHAGICRRYIGANTIDQSEVLKKFAIELQCLSL